MTQFETNHAFVTEDSGLKDYILRVYLRMGMALVLTTAVAYAGFISMETRGVFAKFMIMNPIVPFVLAIVQIGMCLILSVFLKSLSNFAASGLFYGYAAITGLTFSVLPYMFGFGTLFTAFAFAAVMFICCVVIGKTTKVDMSRFGGLLMAGLVTMLVTTILSLFIPALRDNLFISYLGVVLFLGLTAYDMQRIKSFYYAPGEIRENLGTYGAFQLYLDFINLFLRILTILARNSNRKK